MSLGLLAFFLTLGSRAADPVIETKLSISADPELLVTVSGPAGFNFQIEVSNELSAEFPNWFLIADGYLTNGVAVIDGNALSVGEEIRFYRATVWPEPTPDFLMPGETYTFTDFNFRWQTMVLLALSPTNGVWIANPDGDDQLEPVTLEYEQHRPGSATLTIIQPPDPDRALPGFTNYATLWFESAAKGGYTFSNQFTLSQGAFSREIQWAGKTLAPEQLTAGEVFETDPLIFNWNSRSYTAVVTGPGKAVLVTEDSIDKPILDLTFSYERTGPYTALFTSVIPGNPDLGFEDEPIRARAVFTQPDQGYYVDELQSNGRDLYSFAGVNDLEGKTPAPATLSAGDIYEFRSGNGPTLETRTLLLDGSGGGVLFGGRMNWNNGADVSINFFPSNSFRAVIESVIPPSDSLPGGMTNRYDMVFTGETNGLAFATGDISVPTGVEAFKRNTNYINQQIAPLQLLSGENYLFTRVSAGASNLTRFVPTNETSGILIGGNNFPPRMDSVDFAWRPEGLLVGTLTLIVPGPIPGILVTNHLRLGFTSPASGLFADSTLGSDASYFTRDTNAIGKTLSLPSLEPGTLLAFRGSFPIPPLNQFLVIGLDGNATLIDTIGVPAPRFVDVKYSYIRTGSYSAELVLESQNAPINSTNRFQLLFFSETGGALQSTDSASGFPSVGKFQLSTANVGRTLAPPTLTAGERYVLSFVSAGLTNVETLTVNSPNSGLFWAFAGALNAGLPQKSLSYARQDLAVASLEMVDAIDQAGLAQTNNFRFVFTNDFSGFVADIDQSTGLQKLGTFQVDRTWVGRTLAPTQLPLGAMFQFIADFGPTNALKITSAGQGIWTSHDPPFDGSYPVSLRYFVDGPLAARIEIDLPADPPDSDPWTERLILIFIDESRGLFRNEVAPAVLEGGAFTWSR